MRTPATIVATAALTLVLSATAAAAPLAYVTQGRAEPGPPHANGLAVYDVATGRRVRTIALPSDAFSVALAPSGRRAYVTTSNGLAIVDLPSGHLAKTVAGVGGAAAADPSGQRVYVTNQAANRLDLVDATTGALGTPIAVGPTPRDVVVDPAGTHAYTGDVGAISAPPYYISTVDLTQATHSDWGSSDFDRPERLAIAPSGGEVYAANFGASSGGTSIAVFTPPSTTKAVTVGTTPTGLMATPSGAMVVVADRDSNDLALVDAASQTKVGSIALGFSPTDVAVAPNGVDAVATGSEHVAFVNLAERKVTAGPRSLPAAGDVAIAPAEAPVPAFVAHPAISRERTRFDAASSRGGPIAVYAWRFGDGKSASGASAAVSHRYAHAGTFTVRLTETNVCAANAVFGPLGEAWNGHGAFCRGPRAATKTKPVVVPRAALAIVRSGTARVNRDGAADLKLACVRELRCGGRVRIRWHGASRGSSTFAGIAAGGRRTVEVHLSTKLLAAVLAHGKRTVHATVTTRNPHHRLLRRSRKVQLRAS